MAKPNVFISWSKDRSKQIAKIVSWWVGEVVQAATPWYSDADIEAGTRSLNEISDVLSSAKIGIICITSENAAEPWLNFEAGALSKQLGDDGNKVIPLLFGYDDPADLRTPVNQFQGVLAKEAGFENVALSINNSLSEDVRRSEVQVRESCKRIWPELSEKLATVPVSAPGHKTARSQDDMLREAVNILRELDLKIDRFSDLGRSHTSSATFSEGSSKLKRERAQRGLNRNEASIFTSTLLYLPGDINADLVRIKLSGQHLTIETPRPLSSNEEQDIADAIMPDPNVNSISFSVGPPF